jgi:hypothetical protein
MSLDSMVGYALCMELPPLYARYVECSTGEGKCGEA